MIQVVSQEDIWAALHPDDLACSLTVDDNFTTYILLNSRFRRSESHLLQITSNMARQMTSKERSDLFNERTIITREIYRVEGKIDSLDETIDECVRLMGSLDPCNVQDALSISSYRLSIQQHNDVKGKWEALLAEWQTELDLVTEHLRSNTWRGAGLRTESFP